MAPPRKQPSSATGHASKTTASLPAEEAFDLDGHEFSDIDLEAETPAVASRAAPNPKPASRAAAPSKPKKATGAASSKKKSKSQARSRDDDGDASMAGAEADEEEEGQEEARPNIEDQRAEIPRDLLTRILHGFFAKENTRITTSANDVAAAYLDTFVREAIVRASDEAKSGAFLEVEDLEKVGPQLLLDL